jgi:A/G-specific adenine glycosylase
VDALLAWYAPRRRAYPWRAARDPYRVLVAEVMLQQTQAARVVPAYRAFLRRFPSVGALASAPRAEVLRAWSGLGYNRRAAHLHEAARTIVRDHGGRVPGDPEALQRLPGVGPYTAAAVAAIAFGVPVPAIDVNVARVVSRARLGAERAGTAAVRRAALAWLDGHDPAAWNQALMDLGREVCRPLPRCGDCPLSEGCRALARGVPGGRAPRPRTPFEGSFRQVRGRVLRAALAGATTLGRLAAETGEPLDRVGAAVAALARDGLLVATHAALAGRPSGRVRPAG